jgi:hypothetical protein
MPKRILGKSEKFYVLDKDFYWHTRGKLLSLNRRKVVKIMVGTTGFEPATT